MSKETPLPLSDSENSENILFYPKSPFFKNNPVESELFSRNDTELKRTLEWMCRTPNITTYRVNLLSSSVKEFKTKLESALAEKYDTPPEVYCLKEISEVVCSRNFENPPTCPTKGLKEVMVDVACGAALLRGAHVYVPGVLSMLRGTQRGDLVNVYADLEGKCKKGTNVVYESEYKCFIGTGIVKMQREQLYGETVGHQGIAIEMISTISGVPSIGNLSSPDALLQNLPSIICVRVLDPRPGETILDMCAAPGNKTTHIAELMGDKGHIIALDRSEIKINLLRNKTEAYQLKSIKAFTFNSLKVFMENCPKQSDFPPFAAETFDRILLDAPCSGTGNRPLLSVGLSTRMLKSYPKIQKRLLKNAVGLLKPNGVLVYSTCSVSECENEEVVQWVLNEYPQIKLVQAAPIYGGPGIADSGLTEEEKHFVQRFGPGESNRDPTVDSIGFFIAKFVKTN